MILASFYRLISVGNGEDVTSEWNFERASFRRNDRPKEIAVSSPALEPPFKGPPNPAEAEMNIHQHMQSLLLSSRQSQNIARLPSTIYRADGQISDVYWRNGRHWSTCPFLLVFHHRHFIFTSDLHKFAVPISFSQ
ncbi:hypothetical protein Q1695_015685 [Nippostrongylus brasiliensis]|nr:hypothetical protein Q1695_015685 [Nippostrongylus brasiliensis]